jgi:hypothetical protein
MTAGLPLPPELEKFRSVSERIASPLLGVSLSTLRNWRVSGHGPLYLKAGRRVSYPLQELLAWRDARIVKPRGAA